MSEKRRRAAICRAWEMIAEIVRAKNSHGSTTTTRTRTEISVESHEVFVIRALQDPGVAGSEEYGDDVRDVTIPVVRPPQTTEPDIGRSIEDGFLQVGATGDRAPPRLLSDVESVTARQDETDSI